MKQPIGHWSQGGSFSWDALCEGAITTLQVFLDDLYVGLAVEFLYESAGRVVDVQRWRFDGAVCAEDVAEGGGAEVYVGLHIQFILGGELFDLGGWSRGDEINLIGFEGRDVLLYLGCFTLAVVAVGLIHDNNRFAFEAFGGKAFAIDAGYLQGG